MGMESTKNAMPSQVPISKASSPYAERAHTAPLLTFVMPELTRNFQACCCPSRNVIFHASADPMRLVQEELAVAERRFGVLIDSHDDCLDVVVAPTFARR